MPQTKLIYGVGRIPKASEFQLGEVIVNVDDSKVYSKSKSNVVFEIGTNNTGSSTTSTIAFSTASVFGSGFITAQEGSNTLIISGGSGITVATGSNNDLIISSQGDPDSDWFIDTVNNRLTASLDVYVDGDITSSGVVKVDRIQGNTYGSYISFTESSTGIILRPNGNNLADFDTDVIHFNKTNSDVDFRIDGDTNDNLFFVDAGTENIGIGTNVPSQKLVVAGNISASGDVQVKGAVSSSTYRHNGGSIDINAEFSRIALGNNKIDFRTFGEGFDRKGPRMSLTQTELRIGSHSNNTFGAFDELSPVDVIVTGSINTTNYIRLDSTGSNTVVSAIAGALIYSASNEFYLGFS